MPDYRRGSHVLICPDCEREEGRVPPPHGGYYIHGRCLRHAENNEPNLRKTCGNCAALLEALEDLMKSCQNWAPQIDRSRARAAIKLAKGETV